ncbi:phosphatidylinositol-specific phospholipase C [Bacillus cereus]|nr:phosphatidylinositol-specific phospholipase C [Bacillus cereus]
MKNCFDITPASDMTDLNGVITIDRSGYSFNTRIPYSNPKWMSLINNSIRISELSIPGTHGTMARFVDAFPEENLVLNQSLPLADQLDTGIRYIDIRCRHYNNEFAIHHGFVWQRTYFGDDVLKPVINFLLKNPSETILMRVKEEYDPSGNTRTFGETFEAYWNPNQAFFWNPTSQNPTLQDVRGKIILLQEFNGPNNKMFGINYNWDLRIQDQWNIVAGPQGIYNKWTAVKNHFYSAMNNKNSIHLNHLSGSGGQLGGPYPWFIASGYTGRNNIDPSQRISNSPTDQWPDFPRNATNQVYYGGMNLLSTRRIRDKRITHTGIIAADFPGAGLIQFTIELNGKFTRKNPIHHF